MIIRARAPVRLSLASCGDTDYYIDIIEKGNSLNATVDLYAYCEIHKRKDNKIILRSLETGHVLEFNSLIEIKVDDRDLGLMKAIVKHYKNTGIEVVTYTDAPLESGLGGSAAHAVSMIKAFDELNNIKRNSEETAKLAYDIERNVVKIAGGYQDQYASAFRGINYMEFTKGKVKVHPIILRDSDMEQLENSLLLVFIPRDKKGKDVHKEQKERGKETKPLLLLKRDNVSNMKKSIESKKFSDLGRLLSLDWKLKKQLSSGISNENVDKIYKKALEAGAEGGRFVGAGAGGAAIFYCPGKKNIVLKKLEELGVREIKFHFERFEKTRINMEDKIKRQIEEHHKIISEILSTTSTRKVIETIAKKIVESYRNGGKVVIFGNGGSAADAQHIAGELVGRFKIDRPMLNCIALNVNTSVMTAIANDISYDKVFSRQVENLVSHGDIVIGISTSGNSPNIIEALKVAKERDILTVGFGGQDAGKMEKYVDIMLSIPSKNTPRIQEAHIMAGHIICELVEEELYGK